MNFGVHIFVNRLLINHTNWESTRIIKFLIDCIFSLSFLYSLSDHFGLSQNPLVSIDENYGFR